ncbi:amidase signature domain-containing protein [Lophiotrema nucula]|uniref:Amidase signature domain-containing protein n=1 Tax=Lophiotrema nucula TaxID=690887 RepID=A0A6A5ZI68_9PLEO|nr:amidase signature domain-containing protein [Lophiotrema nucula]
MATPPIADWETLASSKRAQNHSKIPKEWLLPSTITDTISETSSQNVLDIPTSCGLLTPQEVELTERYDATDLISKMSKGEVKSYDVTLAFCKRAAIAHQLVNCLTEIFFEEALARARQCDDYIAKEGRPIGPLHGLPISLKDSFNVKGVQTTIGFVSFLKNPPATSNSYLVDLLFKAGAVFYVKTNLPQTMMTADSHNNVFGRTLNPNNLSLTAGGSTGGEGALVKLRGSVLGLTTDVAGSNRIPALCNGITSLKPTASRVPFGGGVGPGRYGSPTQILPVIGPACHSVRDVELFLKTVLSAKPWEFDENVMNVPWRTVEPVTKPLRFGLIRGHPKRPLHPPIARALHSAATALKAAGHSMVLLDDKIPDLYDTALLAWKYFLLDPKKTPVGHVNASGEPWVPSIMNCRFEELADWKPTLDELWDMNVERAKILRVYKDLMVENKLDAIVMAGYQSTAVSHDTYGVPIYTVLQNILNYPAGIITYLKASKQLDEPFFKADAAYEPPYPPDLIEGAPGAVQVVGRPMQDEELVEIMKVVEDVLKKAS